MRLNGRFLCLFTEEKLVMIIVVSAHWDSPPLTHTTEFCVSCRTHCSFYSHSSFWKCLRESKSCAQKLQCELKIFMQIYWYIFCAKENNKKAGAKFRQILFSHNLCLCLLPCDLYLFSGPIFLLCFLTVDPEEEKQILSWMEQAKNPSASRVSTNWSMLLEYLKLKLIPYFTLWEVISTSKVRSFRICRVLALQLPPASKRGKV